MNQERDFVCIINSLYNLFVSIRAVPNQESIKEILTVFKNHITGIINNKKITINILIYELKKAGNFFMKDYIIKELKQFKSNNIKINIEWIKKNFIFFIEIFDKVLDLYNSGEYKKLSLFSSALHNYPHFLIGKYNLYKPKEFWDLHISYYKNKCNDPYLDKFKDDFFKFYKIS